VKTIAVNHKERDGWHVYTSVDIPGLYVAHPNDEIAFADVPGSIRLLCKLNDGIDWRIDPGRSRSFSCLEFVVIS
jgi:hypothetical protein